MMKEVSGDSVSSDVQEKMQQLALQDADAGGEK